jgi:hypothetical protein
VAISACVVTTAGDVDPYQTWRNCDAASEIKRYEGGGAFGWSMMAQRRSMVLPMPFVDPVDELTSKQEAEDWLTCYIGPFQLWV